MDYNQAPLSMGFSRQECWSGLPIPLPGDLPYLGVELVSPHTLQADSLPSRHWGSMTNLDSLLKSRGITLLAIVHIVKVAVFPVVVYRCESWIMKKAEP